MTLDPPVMKGALAPVVMPFKADGTPDADRLIDHCRRLLAVDCGLAVFGTNSEGNSLSVEEKVDLIDRLVEAGLDPARMMPGTGACALPDAIRLTAHAVRRGCHGALVLPPFYYKDVTDEGLYAAIAGLIEGVGDARTRLYLYHIPKVAVVGFSLPLIERLVKDFPTVVVGMKDSTGDEAHSRRIAEALPGWGLFVGSEMYLANAMAFGAVGTISALCNVNAPDIVALTKGWNGPAAADLQERCRTVRGTFMQYPVIAAMKEAIASGLGDPQWRHLRPPLMALSEEQRTALARDLAAIGFRVPLPEAA